MPPKGAIETPDAWDLRRLRVVVQAVADGDDIAAATGLSNRHVNYHLAAARILGWTSASAPPGITPAGRELLASAAQSAAEAELIKSAVLATEVVASVVPNLFDDLTIAAVTQLLAGHSRTGLSTSTARKRASTLVRWRDQLAAVLGQSASTALTLDSVHPANRILLVHLSDIHLRREDELTRLLSRVPGIAAAVAARPDAFGIDACLVVVSGDVAFSGKPAEHELAQKLLDDLQRHLQARFPTCEFHTVLLPGNHDCDFGQHHGMRERLITDVDPSKVDVSYVEGCTAVQTAFWEFSAPRHESERRRVTNQAAMQIHEFTLGNRLVRAQLVNTAWMSTLTEQQGALVVPEKTIDAIATSASVADLVISSFHHGYNWLEANNARRFRDAIERTSDVVLTGHEHVADHFYKTDHQARTPGTSKEAS